MKPFISIIIPCYNSGQYLHEALESVKSYPNKEDYDVVIVNDGSTDSKTLKLLNNLEVEGYKIIHQENKGPAAARNTGIKYSNSKYILFLDSDNKIRPEYIEKGIKILENNNEVGVVYGNPNFFGDSDISRFKPREFTLHSIILGNYIDMCSIIRRKIWEDLEGLDENRIIIGHEDWDFWLRAGAAGWKFHYINEVLYDYRIRKDSLVMEAIQSESHQKMLNYFHTKHLSLILKLYRDLHNEYCYYKNDQMKPLRSFIKYIYKKMI